MLVLPNYRSRPSHAAALPVEFLGHVFRSKLEARWAWIFETLAVQWQYEPAQFDFGELRYCPDFLLAAQETWVEIKPSMPNQRETAKVEALFLRERMPVYVFAGSPSLHTFLDENGVPEVAFAGVSVLECSEITEGTLVRRQTLGTEGRLLAVLLGDKNVTDDHRLKLRVSANQRRRLDLEYAIRSPKWPEVEVDDPQLGLD